MKRSSGWYRWPPSSLLSPTISYGDCRGRMHSVVWIQRNVRLSCLSRVVSCLSLAYFWKQFLGGIQPKQFEKNDVVCHDCKSKSRREEYSNKLTNKLSGRFSCWKQDRLGWRSSSTSGSVSGVWLSGFYSTKQTNKQTNKQKIWRILWWIRSEIGTTNARQCQVPVWRDHTICPRILRTHSHRKYHQHVSLYPYILILTIQIHHILRPWKCQKNREFWTRTGSPTR